MNVLLLLHCIEPDEKDLVMILLYEPCLSIVGHSVFKFPIPIWTTRKKNQGKAFFFLQKKQRSSNMLL